MIRPPSTRRFAARPALFLLGTLWMLGCGGSEAPSPTPVEPPTATQLPKAAPPPPLGTVQGAMRVGKPIRSETVPTIAVDGCPAGVPTGNVHVGEDLGLKDVAVLFARGPRSPKAPATKPHGGDANTSTLRVTGCQLDRRAVVVRVGDVLEIHNDDLRFHALGLSELDGGVARRAQTIPLSPKEQSVRMTLDQPGFFALSSDQTPWLRGLVLVLRPQEQAVVTDANGGFTAADLEPGSWNVTARHGTLGAKETTVEVVAGETAALYEVLGPVE